MTGLDHRVQHWVVLHRTGWLTPLFEAATWLGTWGVVWIAIGLAGALALGAGTVPRRGRRAPGGHGGTAPAEGRLPPWRSLRDRRWDVLVAAVAAVLLAEGAAAVVKVIVQRHRPEVGLAGPAAVVRVPHTYSFPSGHSTVAFAAATALALALPWAWSWLPLLLLAAAVAYSRVYLGVHWPADVVAGVILGTPLGAVAWWLAPRLRGWGVERLRPHGAPRPG